MITYDDFAKLDIRIGTILSAVKVPETDKLLDMKVDVGEVEPRTIVAGIAEHISDLGDLIGVQLPILINLEPRSIKGIESEGMILAASNELTEDEDENHFSLLSPRLEIKPGSKIK